MAFDPRNVPAYLAVLMCLAFAVWLWHVGTKGSAARQLSILFVVEGIVLVTSGAVRFGQAFDVNATPGTIELGVFFAHHAADVALMALYPPFLARALGTRWTAPFASIRMRIALGVAAFALLLFVFDDYWARVSLLYLLLCLTFVYALVVSVQAWREAATDAQRRRARAFAIGFGIRDVSWGVFYGYFSYLTWQGAPLWTEIPTWYLIYPIGTLVEIPLIAYGILSSHLFDIDLRLKWTIRQSTLAAIVIATIYFTSEATDRLLSTELGSWPGLVAAALLMFLLASLQRLADRVANRAMPNTTDAPAYVAYRKLQVYEAALVDALEGGDISAKERALLARLCESLGIAEADAAALESDLRRQQEGPEDPPAPLG
jgi:hypothetical protein